MSNMSYCRFQNTLIDLDDCRDALEVLFHGGDPEGDEGVLDARPGNNELRAAKDLVVLCADIVRMVVEYAGLEMDAGDLEDRDLCNAIDVAQADAIARERFAHDDDEPTTI